MRKIKDRMINSAVLFFLFLIIDYFASSLTKNIILSVLFLVAAIISGLVLAINDIFFWKCPHCDSELRFSRTFNTNYCPYCGNDLFYDEKPGASLPYESKEEPLFKNKEDDE